MMCFFWYFFYLIKCMFPSLFAIVFIRSFVLWTGFYDRLAVEWFLQMWSGFVSLHFEYIHSHVYVRKSIKLISTRLRTVFVHHIQPPYLSSLVIQSNQQYQCLQVGFLLFAIAVVYVEALSALMFHKRIRFERVYIVKLRVDKGYKDVDR